MSATNTFNLLAKFSGSSNGVGGAMSKRLTLVLLGKCGVTVSNADESSDTFRVTFSFRITSALSTKYLAWFKFCKGKSQSNTHKSTINDLSTKHCNNAHEWCLHRVRYSGHCVLHLHRTDSMWIDHFWDWRMPPCWPNPQGPYFVGPFHRHHRDGEYPEQPW